MSNKYKSVIFRYMYRDNDNYKTSKSTSFGIGVINPEISEEELALYAATEGLISEGDDFIARQIGLDTARQTHDIESDNCWDEAVGFGLSDQDPEDWRTFAQFLEDFKKASEDGWESFDPCEKDVPDQELIAFALRYVLLNSDDENVQEKLEELGYTQEKLREIVNGWSEGEE
jgi:hypothetical protein